MNDIRDFTQRVRQAIQDRRLRAAMHGVAVRFTTGRKKAMAELPDPDGQRRLGKAIRERTLAELDRHLQTLARQVEANGGHVYFAANGDEANRIIVGIARQANARLVVKSKSMVGEEIELNHALETAGITPVETDLGEWIVQLAGERPSHIVGPAVHKDRFQVAELFSRQQGRPIEPDIPVLNEVARQTLRRQFLAADMGISGCNFVIAETGTVVVVTNEGNGRLVTGWPRVHVALMGAERVVPTWDDLVVLLPLLIRSATGQRLSSYVSCVSGPRRPGEADGPDEFHLVILDNGRIDQLGGPFQEVLQCIRCGACLNVCPVYEEIGGHAYGWVYSGPIGAVITPLFLGLHQAGELPYASSLCGACLDACPVMIDLPRMLLELRWRQVAERRTAPVERLMFTAFAHVAARPWLYRLAARLGAPFQRPFVADGHIRRASPPLSAWTGSRDFPPMAGRPFHQRWKELADE
jgi:L-lactate dehydrogenase complex protein LldF